MGFRPRSWLLSPALVTTLPVHNRGPVFRYHLEPCILTFNRPAKLLEVVLEALGDACEGPGVYHTPEPAPLVVAASSSMPVVLEPAANHVEGILLRQLDDVIKYLSDKKPVVLLCHPIALAF